MTFYLDTEHQLEGPKKKGTLVIDSKTEPQIQITVNKEFPSRLNIVLRDGGAFSPAAGAKFYASPKAESQPDWEEVKRQVLKYGPRLGDRKELAERVEKWATE